MPWILAAMFLLAYEAYALRTGHKTLSRMMWEATKRWPFLGVLVGLVVGALMTHLFWLPTGCDPTKGF